MNFCTAICCMDGRIQLPVINYLKEKYNTKYVDMITEAGVDRVLGDQDNDDLIKSVLTKLDISISAHGSQHIAVVGHYDCTGNPVQEHVHLQQIESALEFLNNLFSDITIIGLWVDENWNVIEV